jgi:copper(I)-binding protein
MQKHFYNSFVGLALLALFANSAVADNHKVGNAASNDAPANSASTITIENSWVRAVPPVSRGTAGYFDMTNTGSESVTVTAVSAAFAKHTMLHTWREDDAGVKTMVHMDAVSVGPGETVTFEPGAKHLMIMGLSDVPAEGETVELCFEFDNQPRQCAPFAVKQGI